MKNFQRNCKFPVVGGKRIFMKNFVPAEQVAKLQEVRTVSQEEEIAPPLLAEVSEVNVVEETYGKNLAEFRLEVKQNGV